MSLALRPYVTAGVALVGASVIAATPLAAPPAAIDNAAARVSSAAVELTAAIDPIAAWADLFTHTPESLLALGNLIAENPAPILGQIVTNWSGYGQTLGSALQTAGMGLSTYLTTTLPTSLQKFANQLVSGDMQGAAQTFVDAISSLATGAGFPMLNVFSIPVEIAQNLANAVASLPGLVTNLGVSALTGVNGASLVVGDSAQVVVDAIKAGDPLAALNGLAAMPAVIADGVLNGFERDGGLYAGLLTVSHPRSPDAQPWDPQWPDGIPAALVRSRLAIAKAIGWEDPASTGAVSHLFAPTSEPTALPSPPSVPDVAAATSVTLPADATPVEAKANTVSTAGVVAAPAGSAPTEAAGSQTTQQESAPLVRKSLVAIPGKTGALGSTSKPAAKVASDVRDGISSTVNKVSEGVKKAFAKPEKKSVSSTSAGKGADSGSSGDAK